MTLPKSLVLKFHLTFTKVAHVFVKVQTLLLFAKFMTEPKCGETQATEFSFGGAAITLC
jgi:hypothetical protein